MVEPACDVSTDMLTYLGNQNLMGVLHTRRLDDGIQKLLHFLAL